MSSSTATNGDINGTADGSQSFIYPRVDAVPSSDQYYLNNPDPDDDLSIPDHLFGTKRQLRVVVLGSGMSGINFFKFAEDKATNLDIVCYEKNADIGGTWLENRYPGCACDIPSVVYQYPWRPASWSKYYSHSPEIWAYVKQVADENDFVRKYIKLSHEVKSLSWSSDTAQWSIEVEDLKAKRPFTDKADFIINCTGVLNAFKFPTDIPGLHSFKGALLHSAQWNTSTDLANKRVALIGAGSSAVQILPNIYNSASHVYTWIRSAIWITAGFAQKFAGKDGANFEYNEEQKQFMAENPDEYKAYCKMIEAELNQRFAFIINGSKAQKDAVDFSINEMKTKLKGRPDLLEQIMPQEFFVGCRRPTPGNGYLEALAGEKTTAYTQQLSQITKSGFLDPEGVEHEVDVIICATGFDTSYRPRLPIIVDGKDMRDVWPPGPPPTYLSVGLADVPNYLLFAGAYCPAAHGSFFPLIQCYSDYALQVLNKLQTEDIKSIRPSTRATQAFLRHADTFLKRTAWTGPCSSWFKGGKKDGKPAIWPGSRLHFLRLLEKVRFEDYDIEYKDEENMFGFLGNGFHVCEKDGSDITWYLGKPKKEVNEEKVLEVMDGQKGIELGTR